MQIQVLSDLHTEYWKDTSRFPEIVGDVLVLAGDICNISDNVNLLVSWLETLTCPVIYVAGNHEFYGSKLDQARTRLRNKLEDLSHVHFLDAESIEIDGVLFIGATLWTQLNPVTEQIVKAGMEWDFSKIKDLTIGRWNRMFQRDYGYIKHVLSETRGQKVVVVTHHSPSFQSCSDKWRGHPLNVGFHSSLEELIMDYEPLVWIHGHTHDPFDYYIRGTRIVCNPRGYPREILARANEIGWDPFKLIDIS